MLVQPWGAEEFPGAADPGQHGKGCWDVVLWELGPCQADKGRRHHHRGMSSREDEGSFVTHGGDRVLSSLSRGFTLVPSPWSQAEPVESRV